MPFTSRADCVLSAINSKQDKLSAKGSETQPIYIDNTGAPAACTVDTAPTDGSDNLISSGAVYSAINSGSGGGMVSTKIISSKQLWELVSNAQPGDYITAECISQSNDDKIQYVQASYAYSTNTCHTFIGSAYYKYASDSTYYVRLSTALEMFISSSGSQSTLCIFCPVPTTNSADSSMNGGVSSDIYADVMTYSETYFHHPLGARTLIDLSNDWDVTNSQISVGQARSSDQMVPITITGITGSSPAIAKVVFGNDETSQNIEVPIGSEGPNISNTYVSQTVLDLLRSDTRRMDLCNSDGDVMVSKQYVPYSINSINGSINWNLDDCSVSTSASSGMFSNVVVSGIVRGSPEATQIVFKGTENATSTYPITVSGNNPNASYSSQSMQIYFMRTDPRRVIILEDASGNELARCSPGKTPP